MSFYVFDLDGTLADVTHRLHFIKRDEPDWRGFFAACVDDAPIWNVVYVLEALSFADHRIEIWSGRPDEVEAETRAWLRGHGISPRFLTFMRKAGDKRPDDVIKREYLRRRIKIGQRPDAIFDDRDRVVEMWRAEGVPCFQVAKGEF